MIYDLSQLMALEIKGKLPDYRVTAIQEGVRKRLDNISIEEMGRFFGAEWERKKHRMNGLGEPEIQFKDLHISSCAIIPSNGNGNGNGNGHGNGHGKITLEAMEQAGTCKS